MKYTRHILTLCAILCSQYILSIAHDSINLRLAYDAPVSIYKNLHSKQGVITIKSDTETDEYFYITIYKSILCHAYLKAVSDRQIVYGWMNLKKEQLYVIIKDTKDSAIKLYGKPREDDRYFIKFGEFGLFPVVDLNIHTGWVYIRYIDGKCYWVPRKYQCPWYTECYGS